MVEPKVCTVPCKPIAEILSRLVTSKLFYWCVGGLAGFTVIVIGGMQWAILSKVSDISENVAVVKQSVVGLNNRLDYHITTDDQRHLLNSDKIDKLKEKQYELMREKDNNH